MYSIRIWRKYFLLCTQPLPTQKIKSCRAGKCGGELFGFKVHSSQLGFRIVVFDQLVPSHSRMSYYRFLSAVCVTRGAVPIFFSGVCHALFSFFCVVILKTKQLIRWLNRFIESVRLKFKELVNQNTLCSRVSRFG